MHGISDHNDSASPRDPLCHRMLETTACNSEECLECHLRRRYDMGVRLAGGGKRELGMANVEIECV